MENRAELPEGFIAFVKRDCPTCVEVAPVLAGLADSVELTVFTQDDPMFPAEADWVVDDTELEVSFGTDIDVVPTILRVIDGVEVARTVGWQREQWQDFFEITELASTIRDWMPGCGSLSVDPGRVDSLVAKFGGTGISSRRVELAELEDEHEAMFERGWSDGLPLVPPTEARVARMLEGTSREADEVVAVVPPNLVECTVEKVAVNAVMAGCLPGYLPVVLAGLEAICTDEFNMHGVLATTMGVGPIFVVNGPIRHEIGMNSGMNVFGQGNRANLTIGRAVQLVVRNVGGGLPGGIDRATQGAPSKLGMCFAEDEEGSAWESLALERGFDPDASTLTAFCGESPHIVMDQVSRTPESLTKLIAQSLLMSISPRMVMGCDAMLVISPEHMARFADAGWSKERFREELASHLTIPADSVLAGADGIEEGLPAAFAGHDVPKLSPSGGFPIVHAGGPAGLFSSIINGWVAGHMGSVPVTVPITK